MHSLTSYLVSLISALSLVGGCHGKGPTGPAFAPGGTRVLFIGNSLTYSNNLPRMYIALARLAGNTTVEAASWNSGGRVGCARTATGGTGRA